MQRSSFDFDVVSGPAPTRSAPKPEPKPATQQKPPAGEAQAISEAK